MVGISYHEFWSREHLAYIHDPNLIDNSGKNWKTCKHRSARRIIFLRNDTVDGRWWKKILHHLTCMKPCNDNRIFTISKVFVFLIRGFKSWLLFTLVEWNIPTWLKDVFFYVLNPTRRPSCVCVFKLLLYSYEFYLYFSKWMNSKLIWQLFCHFPSIKQMFVWSSRFPFFRWGEKCCVPFLGTGGPSSLNQTLLFVGVVNSPPRSLISSEAEATNRVAKATKSTWNTLILPFQTFL